MVRIVKHGNKNRYIRCEICGAILSYNYGDEQKWYLNSYGNDYEHYIICPDCGRRVIIERRKGYDFEKMYVEDLKDLHICSVSICSALGNLADFN